MWTKLKRHILAIHFRLLPDERGAGWLPYFWLVYLGLFFQVWRNNPPAIGQTAVSLVGLVLFLALYFRGFWLRGTSILKIIAGILVLGTVLMPVNYGAVTFYIYAASFCGRFGPPKRAFALLLVVLLISLGALSLFDISPRTFMGVAVFVLLVGSVNIHFYDMGRKDAQLRLSQDEIHRLGVASERERIARDLHDLLGQTLSMISLKSQLAGRLVARDPQRAADEIAEVARISQDALKQMRQAVHGYGETDLAGELAAARLAMEAMEIHFTYQIHSLHLDKKKEDVLAMILREAVTNVLRHSRATSCHVETGLDHRRKTLTLTIGDDGRGAQSQEGSGLKGMRGRLEEVGGELSITADQGFQVQAALPVTLQEMQPQGDAP